MTTISELQQTLIKKGIDAYIITRNNMFLHCDILPEENKIMELTGFTGSAGNLIVFQNRCVLLVDSRYDIQARQQTDSSLIEVVCTKSSIGSWLQANTSGNLKILYSAWCHSISEVDYWKRALSNHTFIDDKENLLGTRISEKQGEIFEHDEQFSGISSEEKISYLTKFCSENKLDAFLICEPDCVSWLMNLRSNLIPHTPILRAYALVSTEGEVSLFINDFSKLENELETYRKKTIGLNYGRTPKKLQTILKDKQIWISNQNNPINEWKAIKNNIEIAGIRQAHINDGIALNKFLYWLSNNWQDCDELKIVDQLHEFRSQQPNFHSESFATIAGFGANGAIVHYQPNEQTNLKLSSGSLLLLDSGAQYYNGTTDITRTIAVGTPLPEHKHDFTAVLKAHIAVALSMFPQNTSGQSLDTISRASLWQHGMEYAHGTGHGVGHFLGVHEGPHSLSQKNLTPLQSGMITSIEPGYYLEGQYGIRIENLALVFNIQISNETIFLGLEPLSLAPIDLNLVEKNMLTEKEICWLNNYHDKVFNTISPYLNEDEKAWLKQATTKI